MALKLISLIALCLTLSSCAQHRDMDSQWKDKQIEMNIAGQGNKPPYRGNLRINAIAYNGEVFLAGQSLDPSLLNDFVKQVKQFNDVNKVYNQVREGAFTDFNLVSRDTWISGRVKAMLLADTQIESGAIKVMTEAQEVFLMGSLPADQTEAILAKVRNIDGVKEVFTVIRPR